jgi:5'/3'-nucleotidase SurE
MNETALLRSRSGRWPAVLGALAMCHTGVATAEVTADAPLCGAGPLEILLTNDDGFEAPGIRALHAALRSAGHRVRLVAPATNASGTSSSFTWGRVNVTRSDSDADVFGVAGTPATAVVLGATALYPPGVRPDLVVSGINDGTNTGSVLVLSGTIGAALAGTMLLDPPVPGFAVNAERPPTPEAKAALPAQHIEQVATHVTRLIQSARGWFCERGRIVRATSVLNVNYPARAVATVAGVRVATQGRTTDLHLVFEPVGEGVYDSKRKPGPPASDARDSDNVLLEAGYVTVTPLSAVLGDRDAPLRSLERRLAR